MLPLTFANASDYDKVQPTDKISLLGLSNLSPGKVRATLVSDDETLAHLDHGAQGVRRRTVFLLLDSGSFNVLVNNTFWIGSCICLPLDQHDSLL